jgi:hypothetical protein
MDVLSKCISATVVILPCEEGEEMEYLKADSVLSACFPNTDDKVPNVLSAVAAKGLEFDKVVLYNFGDKCPIDICNPPDYAENQRCRISTSSISFTSQQRGPCPT